MWSLRPPETVAEGAKKILGGGGGGARSPYIWVYLRTPYREVITTTTPPQRNFLYKTLTTVAHRRIIILG